MKCLGHVFRAPETLRFQTIQSEAVENMYRQIQHISKLPIANATKGAAGQDLFLI